MKWVGRGRPPSAMEGGDPLSQSPPARPSAGHDPQWEFGGITTGKFRKLYLPNGAIGGIIGPKNGSILLC